MWSRPGRGLPGRGAAAGRSGAAGTGRRPGADVVRQRQPALLPVTGAFVRHAEFLVDPALGSWEDVGELAADLLGPGDAVVTVPLGTPSTNATRPGSLPYFLKYGAGMIVNLAGDVRYVFTALFGVRASKSVVTRRRRP